MKNNYKKYLPLWSKIKRGLMVSAMLAFLVSSVGFGQTTLPYSDDFSSSSSSWTLNNGTQTNQWYIGSATGNTGNSLYISNDNGLTNAYTNSPSSATSVVHAYRDIIFSSGTTTFSFQFDWKAEAESCCDYLRVWIVPNTYTPTPGTLISAFSSGGTQYGGNFNVGGTTTWNTENFVLPASYAGDTMRLIFEWRNDLSVGSNPPAGVDNINISAITCSAPTSLTSSNLTATGADIAWTAPATVPGNGYQYYYSISSTAPTSSTIASGSATGTTATLSSLTANTQYYFWVRSICSSTDTSDWSVSATFTTPCNTYTAPYTYDVESATANSNAVIGDCWSTSPGNTFSSYRWNVTSTGTTPSSSTGPSSANSGTHYFFTEASSGSLGDSAFLYMPSVTISSLTTPTLSFYYHMYGADMGGLYIEALSGTTWTALDSIIGEQQTSETAAWIKKSIDLTGYTGNVQIRFVGIRGSSFWGDMSIDDISVAEAPSCFVPTLLTVSNITSSGADIAWTAPTPAPGNGYEYYYSTSSTSPTASTVASGSSSTTSASISGLTGNTQYYVWVRSACSSTEKSIWTTSQTFTTLCNTYTAPYTYDVESATASTSAVIEDCWSTSPANTSSSYRWNVTGTGTTSSSNTGPSSANSGTHYFFTEASNGSLGDSAFLYMPDVDVSGLTTPSISFYYHLYGATMGGLYVEVLNGTTWTAVDSIIGEQQTSETAAWIKRLTTLTGYTGTIQIRFVGIKGSSFTGDMSIDDISIDEAPTCFVPTLLTVSNLTSATADLSWTAPTPTPGNGYEYYYSTSSTAPVATTTASGTASSTSTTINGLTPNTQYYVWVRSICSSTEKSVWSSSVTFTTPCLAAAVPFFEGFESGYTSYSAIGGCWSQEATSSTLSWEANTFATSYNRTPRTGSWDATLRYGGDSWLFHAVQLTANVTYQIKFYARQDGSTATNASISASYGTAANSASMTNTIVASTGLIDGNYQEFVGYFMPATSGTYYIGIHGVINFSPWYITIDDITVAVPPPCTAPDTLSASNITTNSAILNWNGDTTKSYIVEYDTSGFTLGNGTITTVTDSIFYNLSGLLPNTEYDFYVKKICAIGFDTGSYSLVQTFTTLCDTPLVNLGSDSTVCEGVTVILDAGNPGGTYVWNNSSTNQTLATNLGGTYYVTVTDIYGCDNSDTVILTQFPNPVVDLGPDKEVCQGMSVTLDAGNPGNQYLWNTSETNQTINVITGGTYFVTVTDSNLCNGSDTVVITANQPPIVLGITAEQAQDGSYNYFPASPQYVTDFFWDFGDGDTSNEEFPNHRYTQTGNYVITLIVSNGCGADTVSTILHHTNTGINDLSLQKQLKLYPNPAKDVITIKNESSYKMSAITVYNVLGQVIFHGTSKDDHQYQLNLSGYTSGIYTIRVKLNDTDVISKFEVIK